MTAPRPLFSRYPQLAAALPHVPLAQLPTPVHQAAALAQRLHLQRLYIKRDDLSGEQYGGNKVRKLEFLLGKAVKEQRHEVMTIGFAGSNHAAATAFYAHRLGLRSISMLLPQAPSSTAANNLLLSHASNAELHLYDSMEALQLGIGEEKERHRRQFGSEPLLIPAGGSSALGTVGFVNAALELGEQIRRGELAQPDRIYAALGTMGTVAGLAAGLHAAGIACEVAGVRVVDRNFANREKTLRLIHETTELLHAGDSSFAPEAFPSDRVIVDESQYGDGYGIPTAETRDAVAMVAQTEEILLEETYTGKAFAAVVRDARQGRLQGKTVLFWDTYNSRDMESLVSGTDYHALPQSLHEYF